jgi:hypothetical protein
VVEDELDVVTVWVLLLVVRELLEVAMVVVDDDEVEAVVVLDVELVVVLDALVFFAAACEVIVEMLVDDVREIWPVSVGNGGSGSCSWLTNPRT